MIVANAQPDCELLAAFQAGKAEAFEEIYYRHARRMMSYLISMLEDRQLAEDVLQEVFLHFAHTSARLTRETNVAAYLYRSARNGAVSAMRSRKRNTREVWPGAQVFERQKAHLPAAYSNSESDELRARLNTALCSLPEAERDAVMLRSQGELTFQEIAEITQTPLSTVATRYENGIKRLKGMLRHE